MNKKDFTNAMSGLSMAIHNSILDAAASRNFDLLGLWAYIFQQTHEEDMLDNLGLIGYGEPNPCFEQIKAELAKRHLDIRNPHDINELFSGNRNLIGLCSAIVEASSVIYDEDDLWVNNLWAFCPLYTGNPENAEILEDYVYEGLCSLNHFFLEMKGGIGILGVGLPGLYTDSHPALEYELDKLADQFEDEESFTDKDEKLLTDIISDIKSLMAVMESA